MSEVYDPSHYTAHAVETIDKIDIVVEGLDAFEAYCLGNIIKYIDRCGLKGDAHEDLAKANNYAHMLCKGRWVDKRKGV